MSEQDSLYDQVMRTSIYDQIMRKRKTKKRTIALSVKFFYHSESTSE